MTTPTVLQQAQAVELLTVNHRGFCDILRQLVVKGRRTTQELAMAEQYLPALDAAVRTMRYIHHHADAIRADLKLPITTGAGNDVERGSHEPGSGAAAVASAAPDNPPSEDVAGKLPQRRPRPKAVRSPKK